MKQFIGRENELAQLNAMFQSERFEMAVIYGRRRVGKSALIRQFASDKPTLFFQAVEGSSLLNLELLYQQAIEFATSHSDDVTTLVRDYVSILNYLMLASRQRRIVFVIDEYPFLAKSEKSFASLLQNFIDCHYQSANIMIILCGSSISFMTRRVLSARSPLYGRRTGSFSIAPMNYWEVAQFVPRYSNHDKMMTYAIFGGIPYYLSLVNDSLPLKENVINLFLLTGSFLLEEPSNLLNQELRDLNLYNSIITAIANNATRLVDIATRIGRPANLCERYIKQLIDIDLIKKESPGGDTKSRRSLYILKDNMFRFWFRFIKPHLTLIDAGLSDVVIEKIWGLLPSYLGHIFEDLAIQYLWLTYRDLPLQPKTIARWWGPNSLEKRQEEIDIIAFDGDVALFGECKYLSQQMDIDVLQELKRKSMIFTDYPNKYYYLFSRSGFDHELLEEAANDSHLKLIDLDRCYLAKD